MEFPSLSPEGHNASARTQLRRAITSFRNLTYQPGADDATNNLAYMRSARADTLLQNAIPPGFNRLEQDIYPGSFYLLFFDGGSRGNPGPGGSGSVIVKMHPRSLAACVVWIASMAYGRASTTIKYAEYQGLLHGLRQAKANNYTPLHVVGDSALIISQLRSHHSPRKAHLALLFRKARDLADDIAVVIWGHHYRTFNQMADRLANFAMDSCTLVQVHLPSDRRVVKEVATFLDSDVTHWIENSYNEHSDPRSPTATAKDKAISRLQLPQRTAAVRGQTLS